MLLSESARRYLLAFAVFAAIVPNGLYLYSLVTRPDLNLAAMRNPVAMAFMIEAMMLLALFLVYVYRQTGSWRQVALYLAASFAGSLAFSLPLFLFFQSKQRARSELEG